MKYGWSRKKRKIVHLLTEHGKTLCKIENNNKKVRFIAGEIPPDKRLCRICASIEERDAIRPTMYEPSLRVLMGEEMA